MPESSQPPCVPVSTVRGLNNAIAAAARLILFAGINLLFVVTARAHIDGGPLQIHYINVGQGGSTLIIGPNGTRILYDFGRYTDRDIVPYLRDTLALPPTEGLHYTIVSHRDLDHYKGYGAVVDAGYDVLVANYDPGSPKTPTSSMSRYWLDPAARTTAGSVRPIPVGLRIALGNGAEAIVMAANGRVYGDPQPVPVENENDRSVALLINYGSFQYMLDGDLGAGLEECTDHETTQLDVQTRVANAMINQGFITRGFGVDVLHIAHHGSESSTSAAYYNAMKPEIGLISVGLNNRAYLHPREDVIDRILLGPERPPCVTAPPLHLLLQTEDGAEGESTTGRTSNNGLSVGDIVVTTDGEAIYEVYGNNRVSDGAREMPDNVRWHCWVDERAVEPGHGRCYSHPAPSD